jgi:hypothetical protein
LIEFTLFTEYVLVPRAEAEATGPEQSLRVARLEERLEEARGLGRGLGARAGRVVGELAARAVQSDRSAAPLAH